tara:strand:+ start:151 stop:327 length:177 start_codon:yes stop_codon:yes gene_type:complete
MEMLDNWLEKSLQRTEDKLFRKHQKMASPELAHSVLCKVVRPKLQLKQRFNRLYHSLF